METISSSSSFFFFPLSPPSHSSGIAIFSEMGGLSIVVWGGGFFGRFCWGFLKGKMGSCGGEEARICKLSKMSSHPQGPGAECQQRTDASNSWSVAARRREPSSRSQEATLGSRQAWDDPLQCVPTWGWQEMELPWLPGLTHWPCLIPLLPQQQEGSIRRATLSVDKARVAWQGGRAGTRVTPHLPPTHDSHQAGCSARLLCSSQEWVGSPLALVLE